MFKRLLSYYKPHKKLFVLDMLASLSVALLGILYPIVTRTMLNDLIPNRQYRMIIIAGASLFVLYFIRMLLNYFIQYQGHMMGVRMQGQMRSEMFRHLEKLPFSFYDNNETGKIMSRMTSDLNDIAELAHHGPENFIITGITIVISFLYLTSIDVWLTLIVFACVPVLVIVSLTLRKKMRAAFRESQAAIAQINGSLQSSIAGIRVTKAFTNEEKETEKFEEGNSQFMEARRDAYKAMGQFHSATTMITDVFNVVVLIAGGLFLYSGRINFADYSAFIVSINLFLGPVNTLIRFMEQFQNGVAGFERFVEIMETEPETNGEKAVAVARLDGEIKFNNVSSSYAEGKEVLKNVCLSIGKGKTFALVGPSGGGKTTLCHLIPHFYKITDGDIFIDGKSLKNITIESLRQNIGIVQQDIYLFNASIRENILYGKLDATDEEVVEAAKKANIHDYIMSLENGYDTVIGERGVRLSGGQKQRLCIARVFLKNPPILILDEATSALDNATEIQIQKSLDELSEGRTTIVVAHRLSTIKNADEIAVVDNGEITEQGTHEQLLELDGTYAQLYKQQFREV
ncbi:MAG: ABC transporter ATP-binding protein [Oscillospiraceae bacterium]|nr:ABC transporter ATP-binding protein [Oscillospiraceae bacterium]